MNSKLAKFKQIIDKLNQEQGMVSPYAILDIARPETSLIHDMFDWNNTTAGEKYRLWQARHYIKEVTVEMIGKKAQGYLNVLVEIEDVKTRGYFSIDKVLSNEEMKKAVLKDAIARLMYWKNLYKDFSELANLIDQKALDNLSSNL